MTSNIDANFDIFSDMCFELMIITYVYSVAEYFLTQGQQPVEFNHAINYVNKIKVKLFPLVLLKFTLDNCFSL